MDIHLIKNYINKVKINIINILNIINIFLMFIKYLFMFIYEKNICV